MFSHERAALTRIADRLRAELGDVVREVVAFGSRIRGDHGPWSDLDLLIVVAGRTPELEARIVGLVVDVELETGVPVAPVIKDAVAFERERATGSPFYRNVRAEGVPL